MTSDDSTLFIDANILIYATRPASPWHTLAREAIDQALANSVDLVVSPQVLREYLADTTRPAPDGSHTPLADALDNVAVFRTALRVLEENGAVVDMLLAQLRQVSALGRQTHDANIVATMRAHGVRRLLTHNADDFARYNHLITVVPLESSTPAL